MILKLRRVRVKIFLVDRDGKVVYRFGPTDAPKDFAEKIKELIEK